VSGRDACGGSNPLDTLNALSRCTESSTRISAHGVTCSQLLITIDSVPNAFESGTRLPARLPSREGLRRKQT
jgi:hypothetical protein